MVTISREAIIQLAAAIRRGQLWATPEQTAEWLKTERGQRIAAMIEELREKERSGKQ